MEQHWLYLTWPAVPVDRVFQVCKFEAIAIANYPSTLRTATIVSKAIATILYSVCIHIYYGRCSVLCYSELIACVFDVVLSIIQTLAVYCEK